MEPKSVLKLKREPVKRKLTKRLIEALKPPAEVDGRPRQDWIYDTLTPHLTICHWSSGSVKWYWVGRCNARMLRYKLGSYPQLSPENARKAAAKVSLQVAEGEDPRVKRRQVRDEPTLQELFDTYLDQHARPRKKTWEDDIATFNRYCNCLKSRRPSTISETDIRKLHNRIRKRGPYAANRMLSLLSVVFSFNRIEPNPCKGVKKFREQERDRFLQADELQRFFASLEQESALMRDYFMICLLSGARRGNVQSMKWDQLHLDRGEWRVPETKAGEPQTVYLPPEAVEILRQRQETSNHDYVFPSRPGSKQPYVTYQYRAWKRICERAELKDIRPHDLRRSLGSWQAAVGSSLPVIQKTLGHKNASTTEIYARLNLDPVRESVDRAVASMLAAADGSQNT